MCNTPKYAKLEERTGERVPQVLALLAGRALDIRVDMLCFPRAGTGHTRCRLSASASVSAVGNGATLGLSCPCAGL